MAKSARSLQGPLAFSFLPCQFLASLHGASRKGPDELKSWKRRDAFSVLDVLLVCKMYVDVRLRQNWLMRNHDGHISPDELRLWHVGTGPGALYERSGALNSHENMGI